MKVDKKFLCSIYRSAPTPVGAIDMLNKELIFSSGLAERLLGYSDQELATFANNNFEDIIHPEDISKNRESYEYLQTSKHNEVVRSILRVKKSDGAYLHFQVNDMVYERDEDGEPLKFSTIIEDITREAEIKEKLAEACELIKQIKHKNSHELRGPVTDIMSIVNLMKEEHFQNDYQRDLVQYLGETVEKLDMIIHEINEQTSTD